MAPSLVLPDPKNDPKPKAARVEDVDELTEASAQSAAAAREAEARKPTNRFSTGGIIYPPPDIRSMVDKTATFVAKNGSQFEEKIKSDGTTSSSSKFSFLNDGDPYNAYYRAKIEAIRTGEGPLANAAEGSQGDVIGANGSVKAADGENAAEAQRQREERDKPKEPRAFGFSADLPNITAVDLDVLKLTALFTARKGRAFASALQALEKKSYQFEFLRPTHSLFGYYNRLVEQYRTVIEAPEDILNHLRTGAYGAPDPPLEGTQPAMGIGKGGGRLKLLEEAHTRGEWQRWVRMRRKKAEDEQEKEKAAFDEIDWQDFVVVGNVEFTEADELYDLPPPMSLREVENMTMAQRRMAAMIMEIEGGSEEEALDTVGLVDLPGDEEARAAEAPAQVSKPAAEEEDMEMEMDESDDEAETPQQQKPIEATSKAAAAAANPGIKVRKDYQPKSLAERKAAAASQTTTCPVCKQEVPLKDMEEHVRIELLNPKFREQRRDLEEKRAQHNALFEGADPSKALRQLAGQRTDIFGSEKEEELVRRREEEENRKRREKEKIIWDGHAASRQTTRNEFNRPEVLEQTKANIERKFKTTQEEANIGPQFEAPLAQSNALPAPPPSLPPPPAPLNMVAVPGGYVAEPAAPNAYQPPPPPNMGSFGGIHPSRLQAGINPYAAPSSPYDGLVAGQKRPAEGEAQDQPPLQRPAIGSPFLGSPSVEGGASSPMPAPMPPGTVQPPFNGGSAPQETFEVSKLPDGQLHPEGVWKQFHPGPIRVIVKLPEASAISDKFDGGQITFEGLLPDTPIVSIRDRIHAEVLQGTVGASRLKLRIGPRAATMKQTLAHWNLEDNDVIELNVHK